VLALDYGAARCGCALSDPSGTIVTPIEPVANPNSRRGIARLREIVGERAVERILVGLPLTLSGGESAQTRETRAFAARLERALGDAVAVEMYDERFTTQIAQRTAGHAAASEDSRAAAVLLEDWLAARAG